jgi:hypothetical protein
MLHLVYNKQLRQTIVLTALFCILNNTPTYLSVDQMYKAAIGQQAKKMPSQPSNERAMSGMKIRLYLQFDQEKFTPLFCRQILHLSSQHLFLLRL